MQSQLINRGNRLCLEIEVDSTGVNRTEVARAMLAAHGLRDGQAEVTFLNPSSEELDR
jgi:hypothetical protein